jgi:hypothetical protein
MSYGAQDWLKQVESRLVLARDLGHGTGAGGFFGTPAEEFGAVAEAAAGEVVELDFGDEFVVERLPLHGVLGAPAAFASRSFAGEAGRLYEFQEFFGKGGTLFVADGGREADVIESAFGVVEAEK